MGTARTTIDPPERTPRSGPGTEPPPWRGPLAATGALVATGAIAAQLLEAAFDVLPGDAITGQVTLARLILVLGIAGVIVAGARLQSFRTGLDIPLALLLVAGIATTWRGGWDAAPLRFLITSLATYYLVVATLRVVPESRWALALLALAAAGAAGAIGIAQVAEGDFTGFYRDGLEPITSTIERPDLQVRAIGPFVNPNLLAAFIALAVPIGALAGLRMPDPGLRLGALMLVVVAEIGLVLTFSRAAVVAVVAGAVLLAVTMPRLRPVRRPVLYGAGGLLLVLVLAALATGGRAAGSFGRPEAWGLALDAAAQDRLVGVGLGRAGDVMNALGEGDETFAHAHDLWLNWLAEAGPLAFLAMAFITFWLLAEGVRLARAGAIAPAAALAALTAFFLMSVVDHPANSERIAVLFWIVAAALAADATRRVTPGIFTHEAAEDAVEPGGHAPPATPLSDPVPPRMGPKAGEAVRVIRPAAGAVAAVPEAEPQSAPEPEPEVPAEPEATSEPEPPSEPEAEAEVEPEAPSEPEAEAPPEPEAEAPSEPEPSGDAPPDVDMPTAPFDPGETAPMVLPFEPLPPEPSPAEPSSPPERPAPGPAPETGPIDDAEALFARLAAGLEASRDVERTSMMGQPGLRFERRYVAALVDGRDLAVRFGPERAAAIVRDGEGREFAPTGSPLEGWVVIGNRTEAAWRAALAEALAAAGGEDDGDGP